MKINQRVIFILGLSFVLTIWKADLSKASESGSQIVSTQTREELNESSNQTIEEKLSQAAPQAASDNKEEEKTATASSANNQKFLINTIDVQGATIPTNTEIYKIIVPYQGTLMTLAETQKVADQITDLYRQKGFITSRAYIPPQTISNQTLIIKVIEGKLGKVDIKGNKYFRTSLLKNELHLTEDGYFDYSALQRSMVYINQHPDRVASTILAPGQQPGTTDVLVNVKDQLPIHAGFIFDNYGSKYIDSQRYALTLEDNSLLGFDDRMYAKVQTSNSNFMRFGQLQYVVPVTETLNLGAYVLDSNLKLTKDFAALDATGKAHLWGVFFDQAVIQETGFEWRINGGFDFKDIYNSDDGSLISRDYDRVFKLGTEFDITDLFGRTIIDPEIDVGVPGMLNGMKSKDDPLASREGSGGAFQKEVISVYRLQPLPLETSLLWKNTGQWSRGTLPTPEEFELGGPTSVRGYAPAEYSGDKGLYSGLEWSIPPYFIPGSMKLPFSSGVSLRDALRFVTFYDYGFAHINEVPDGEDKNTYLQSYGYGIRFNVRDNLAIRFEVGYPIGRKSDDGHNAQPWLEVSARY